MKICSECKEDKPLAEFNKNKRRKDGYHEYCKCCRKAQYKRRDSKSARERAHYRYNSKKDECLEQMAKRYLANHEAKKEYGRIHYEANKHRYKAAAAQRKVHVKRATPSWLTNDDRFAIREAYHLAQLREQLTGIAWDVDHVIPLSGKLVCGLNVPSNLAVIPRKENNHKRARYEVS